MKTVKLILPDDLAEKLYEYRQRYGQQLGIVAIDQNIAITKLLQAGLADALFVEAVQPRQSATAKRGGARTRIETHGTTAPSKPRVASSETPDLANTHSA